MIKFTDNASLLHIREERKIQEAKISYGLFQYDVVVSLFVILEFS